MKASRKHAKCTQGSATAGHALIGGIARRNNTCLLRRRAHRLQARLALSRSLHFTAGLGLRDRSVRARRFATRSVVASHRSRRTLCGCFQRLLDYRKTRPGCRERFTTPRAASRDVALARLQAHTPRTWLQRIGSAQGGDRRPSLVTPVTGVAGGRAARAGTSLSTRCNLFRVHTSCSTAPPELCNPGPPVSATRVHAWRCQAARLPAWWGRRRLSRPRPKALPRAAAGEQTCVRWEATQSCARRWWRLGHRR